MTKREGSAVGDGETKGAKIDQTKTFENTNQRIATKIFIFPTNKSEA